MVETGDLFGLHRRYRVLTSPHFLLVYPDVVPLEGYELASRRPIGEIHISHRLYEDPTRIAGVRRYELGDPLNRIHWRATARTGLLHCKFYEPSCVAGATLLLDFHQAALSIRATNRFVPSWRSRRRPRWPTPCLKWISKSDWLPTAATPPTAFARRAGTTTSARARPPDGPRHAERERPLEPVTVETRRGPEQLGRILQTLARVELTDGLTSPNCGRGRRPASTRRHGGRGSDGDAMRPPSPWASFVARDSP